MDATSRIVADLSRLVSIAVREQLDGDHAELRSTAELIHSVAADLIRETRDQSAVQA